MPGTITPGASIEDSFESPVPVDAEIPHSPSFAHPAKDVPHYDISDDDEARERAAQLEQEEQNQDEDESTVAVCLPSLLFPLATLIPCMHANQLIIPLLPLIQLIQVVVR